MGSLYDQLAQAYGANSTKSDPNGIRGVDWDIGDGGYFPRNLNRAPAGVTDPTQAPAATPSIDPDAQQTTFEQAQVAAAKNPRSLPFYQTNLATSDQDMLKKFMAADPAEQEKQLNGLSLVHGLSSFRDQESGLKKNQDLIDKFMGMPATPNYSGILQGIDYATNGKTHFADNYKQPLTAEERALMGIKLNAELQKERNQFTGLDARLLQKTMLPPSVNVITTGTKQGEQGGNKPSPHIDHFDQRESDQQAKDYFKETKGIQPLLEKAQEIRNSLATMKEYNGSGKGFSGYAQDVADWMHPGMANFNKGEAALNQLKTNIAALQDLAIAGARGEASPGVYTRIGGMVGALPFSNKDATLRGLDQIIAEAQSHVNGAAKAYPMGVSRFQGNGPGSINPNTFDQPGLQPQTKGSSGQRQYKGVGMTITPQAPQGTAPKPKSTFVPKSEAEIRQMSPDQLKAYIQSMKDDQHYGN